MPVGMSQLSLTHIPGKMRIQALRKALRQSRSVLLLQQCPCKKDKVCKGKRIQPEVKFEQPVDVLVVLEKFCHLVDLPAQQHYRRALGVAHPRKELVKLVHVLRPGGRQQLLRVGYQQDTIFEGSNVRVEFSRKGIPVGCVHDGRALLHHPGREHLRGYQLRDEGLSRARIAQYQAVQSDAGPALGKNLRHLELFVQFLEARLDAVLADKEFPGPVLGALIQTRTELVLRCSG